MSRLRLPDLRALAPPAAPPPPPTPAAAVAILLSRRQFLQALGAATVLLAAPWTRVERTWAAARGRFFTATERRSLEALVDTVLPPDGDPGAADLGVVHYIERFLTAFDARVPRLYAGGPWSGRNPFIDYDSGTPSRRRPRNALRRFVPPTRLQALYWRWELFGTSGLAADEQTLVAPLDAQLGGPLRGLRDLYREGLVQLDALSRTQEGAAFLALDEAARARVRDTARRTFPADPRRGRNFIDLVIQHTIEGAFSVPEYGGNRRAAGWALTGLEGDSQPLGYALYSRSDDAFHQRADHPLSGPNPDEAAGPKPLSPEADRLQNIIVVTSTIFGDGCG
jgi:hypothetical protein